MEDMDVNQVIDNIVEAVTRLKTENQNLKNSKVDAQQISAIRKDMELKDDELKNYKNEIIKLKSENEDLKTKNKEFLSKINRLATILKSQEVQSGAIETKENLVNEKPQMGSFNVVSDFGDASKKEELATPSSFTKSESSLVTPTVPHEDFSQEKKPFETLPMGGVDSMTEEEDPFVDANLDDDEFFKSIQGK